MPRWQIGLYWRTDGQPLWPDEALLADPWAAEPAGRSAEDEAAQQVLAAIADGLGLPLSQVRPAYEDPLARLAAKVRLPAGDPVEPERRSRPADTAAGRAELLARLDESATDPAAFVLPLHRREDDAGWASLIGGCAAAASCCWTGIRRRVCGCRWTRSAGSHRGTPS